jgi:hypothetical protein
MSDQTNPKAPKVSETPKAPEIPMAFDAAGKASDVVAAGAAAFKAIGTGRFKRVEEAFETAGGARRDPSAALVDVTGHTKTNVEGRNNILQLVHKVGADPKKFTLQYGVDESTKEVALYVVPPHTKGAMPVRVYSASATFHMGKPFEKYPAIRPEAKKEFALSKVTLDDEGNHCVILTLAAGVEPRKTGNSTTKGDKKSPETGE